MPSLGPERLHQLALDALEEAVAEAEFRPIRRSWALRLALAYLASLDPRRWRAGDPFRDFWHGLSQPGAAMRVRTLESALTTIYSWAELKRDTERVSFFRSRAEQLAGERLRWDRPD